MDDLSIRWFNSEISAQKSRRTFSKKVGIITASFYDTMFICNWLGQESNKSAPKRWSQNDFILTKVWKTEFIKFVTELFEIEEHTLSALSHESSLSILWQHWSSWGEQMPSFQKSLEWYQWSMVSWITLHLNRAVIFLTHGLIAVAAEKIIICFRPMCIL